MAELRGLPTLPLAELDRRLDCLRTVENPDWNKAQRREAIIRAAIDGDGSARARVDAAAKALDLSARTVRRLVVR